MSESTAANKFWILTNFIKISFLIPSIIIFPSTLTEIFIFIALILFLFLFIRVLISALNTKIY